MNEKFLRLKQVIEIIGVSKATIWRWVNDGTFPKPIKISAMVTVWKNSDIEAYMANAVQNA